MQSSFQQSLISSLNKRFGKMQSEKANPSVNHTRDAFLAMDAMRKNRMFCDVVIVAKNVEILAHKVILASCSHFFYQLFTESYQQDRVSLEDFDPQTLYLLVNYIYTSEIQITHKNVQEILAGANVLLLNTVKNDCCKFLESQLTPDKCLMIMEVAQTYECKELTKKAEAYVDQHFTEVVNSQEFLTLSHEQVNNLISRDGISIPSEENVYECVMTWLKYDLKARRKYLSILMRNVRLPLMSREYLAKNVVNEPILKADLNCKDLIIEALLQDKISSFTKKNLRQRRNTANTLLVMGGYSTEAEGTLEYYNFNENTWSQVYSMPLKRRGTNVAIVNDKVYVVGRCEITRPVNVITEYDVINDRWYNPISMTTSRTYHGVAVLADCIYAVGGRNTQGRLSTAEKFDTKTQKWTNVATMSNRRSWVAVGVMNNLLYAVGGYADYSCPLNSVECYDPQADVWKCVSNMNIPRSGAVIGVLHNKMYVIGGHSGTKCLNSVETYNPETDRWSPAASMNVCRRSATAVVVNDLLFVIGGWDGNTDLSSIEVYDPTNDSWTLLPTQMNIARSSHGSAIIDKNI